MSATTPTAIEAAILRTVLYADIFNFALCVPEIHRFLIHNQPVDHIATIQNALDRSSYLQPLLISQQGYIALHNRAGNITRRIERDAIYQSKITRTYRYGRWLAHIPFVRMVALTGAWAVGNPAHERDDFDYLLVTQPGRVWLARLLAVVLVRVVRLQGYEICPNYVLASDQLHQDRHDLYMAHELAQMTALYGHDVYETMMQANHWLMLYMANTTAQPMPPASTLPHFKLKQWAERLLSGAWGDALEHWEYRRKQRKFVNQMQYIQPIEADAKIDSGHVKGHFQDHGQRVLKQYQARLATYGLEDVHPVRLPMAGD